MLNEWMDDRDFTFGQLRRLWSLFLGEQLAKVSYPAQHLEPDGLRVEVATAHWRRECEALQHAVLVRLPLVDGIRIKRIVFELAPPAPLIGHLETLYLLRELGIDAHNPVSDDDDEKNR